MWSKKAEQYLQNALFQQYGYIFIGDWRRKAITSKGINEMQNVENVS